MICADSLGVEQSLFPETGGGAIPTSALQLRIKECKFSDIRFIFEKYHYKGGHMGGGISFCLALTFRGNIVGGMVIGKLRHGKKYGDKAIEIRRMALLDEMPRNSESYFLSKAIRFISQRTDVEEVISYSDRSVGHIGTIYKAANFSLIGETSPSKHVFWDGVRYHPRSLTINRPYSYRLREAVKRGEASITSGGGKLIFSYKIRRKFRA